MKSALLALFALILGGCATAWPESASLNPLINDQPDHVFSGNTVSIDNQDSRTAQQIISIKRKGEHEVLIPNNITPSAVLADRLGQGLKAQGASVGNQGNTHITLIVDDLLAEVTKPGLAYKTRINLQVRLKMERNGNVLTKEFHKSASKETATQPDISDLEMQLNAQISTLLNMVLLDTQMRDMIRGG